LTFQVFQSNTFLTNLGVNQIPVAHRDAQPLQI
jgi:hypothetical protein